MSELDKIFYYSKSKNVNAGKGVNEYVKDSSIRNNKYKDLNKIKDFRKKLSNFYESPFIINDQKWNTVEHYYQGNKFRKNEKFMLLFTFNSNSKWNKDPNLAKSAGGKSGKSKGKILRPSYILMDKDFEKNKHKIMIIAMFAKFVQNKDLLNLLMKTENLELWHGTRGVKKHRVYSLEKVRHCIRKYMKYGIDNLIKISKSLELN
jgi:ribA/ribD-fused uncharacterized protein